MRRIRHSTESSRYGRRFSGPWSPNPWINSVFVGPQKHRGVDGDARAMTLTIPMPSQDQQRQKAALSAWEDDGGSTGAPGWVAGDGSSGPRVHVRAPQRRRWFA